MTSTPELLSGLPQDYDIIGGGIPLNRTTGEMGRANNANGYIFRDLRAYIVNGKLVVQYPAAGGFTQADLDKARADGRAEGIAAVRAALAGVR